MHKPSRLNGYVCTYSEKIELRKTDVQQIISETTTQVSTDRLRCCI